MARTHGCRRRRQLTGLLLALSGLAGSGCLGSLVSVGAEGRVWFPELVTPQVANDLVGVIDQIDLKSQANLDTNAPTPSFYAWGELLGLRMSLDGFRTSLDGNNPSLGTGFDFGGVTFSPGDAVTTDLDFTALRYNVEYALPIPNLIPGIAVKIWLVLGLESSNIDLDLNNGTTGQTGTLSENIPLLTVGVAGAVRLARLEGYARVQAIESKWVETIADALENVDNLDGMLIDAEIGGRAWITPLIGLGLSYRFYSLDLTFLNGQAADLTMQGFAISLIGKFP